MTSINLNKWDRRSSEYLQTIAFNAVSVTASDTGSFNKCRAFYVGTAGDLVVQTASDLAATASGHSVTFKNLPAGSIIPLSIRRVYSTGTTASDVVVFY